MSSVYNNQLTPLPCFCSIFLGYDCQSTQNALDFTTGNPHGIPRQCSTRMKKSKEIIIHILAPRVSSSPEQIADILPSKLIERIHLIMPSEVLINEENMSKVLILLENNKILKKNPCDRIILDVCACFHKLITVNENLPFRKRKIKIEQKAFESMKM